MLKRAMVAVALTGAVMGAAARGEGPTGQAALRQHDGEVAGLVGKMTLEEKIGQMMQVDQKSLHDAGDIEKYAMGSLLSGGGSGPRRKEDYTFAGWRAMVEGYQGHAAKTRLGIPLLYGIDALHGNNNVPGATIFPHHIGLGCTRDAALLEKIGRATAEETRAAGMNWTFAPCVTTPQDIRWGRTYEGFSPDAGIVAPLAAAEIRGLQGGSLNGGTSVVATAKHFVADGGTAFGSAKDRMLDQGDSRMDEATLRRVHLPAYKAAVDAGVATIMPSYSSWNGTKCSASTFLLTDVLKKELGFEGFLISDYDAIDQISPDYAMCVKTSINAGMDMVMMTGGYPRFAETLKGLVADGSVPAARIDDAVTRILRVKVAAGLLDGGWKAAADPKLEKRFGAAAHRELARQAVRESLVVLKNEGGVLPVGKGVKRIVVAGRGADDAGTQCGGWTIDWQGQAGRAVPGATTLLAGLRAGVASGCEVNDAADGAGGGGAELGIVVIGEAPYAEGRGDTNAPVVSEKDRKLVAGMKGAGMKVVVVIYSGRPLVLGDVMKDADAVVAAWLPGSEAEGISDVLLGAAPATGKLSFAWPASVEMLQGEKPLFPIGYGLTFAQP